MFVIGAPIVFLIANRIPGRGMGRRELASVWWTNLALVVLIGGLCLAFGWQAYLLVQLPVLLIGTSTGIWLFYMQHQFAGVYWRRHAEWDFFTAGLEGCSYFKLPKVLQWFTGNIGFHHIHHLSARIPNYRLEACYRENPTLQQAFTLTLWSSIKSLGLRVYDEELKQLVGWWALKRPRSAATGK
jgi:omega-6 fatty acid desaturase (delta-12 desaturase)